MTIHLIIRVHRLGRVTLFAGAIALAAFPGVANEAQCAIELQACVPKCSQPASSGSTLERNERRNACVDSCDQKARECKLANRPVVSASCIELDAKALKNNCPGGVVVLVKRRFPGGAVEKTCAPMGLGTGGSLPLNFGGGMGMNVVRVCEAAASDAKVAADPCACAPGMKEIALPMK